MAKKKAKKRKQTISNNTAANQQAYRRRRVAQLAARGWTITEIAHELGVAYNTADKDLRMVREQWWQHTQQDAGQIIRREIELLETVRAQALEDYYTCANRHGEIHQTGYLQAWAKLTGQLHDVQRLNDPHGRPMAGKTMADHRVIEVAIETPEQADAVAEGVLDFEQVAEMAVKE